MTSKLLPSLGLAALVAGCTSPETTTTVYDIDKDGKADVAYVVSSDGNCRRMPVYFEERPTGYKITLGTSSERPCTDEDFYFLNESVFDNFQGL